MKSYRPVAPPRSVLVVCMRRIGDVLTATPLVRSLRRAWPDAAIDLLVPPATAPILEGNPDIRRVLVEPPRAERGRFLRSLWRAYDLSVGTQPNDRPFAWAWIAGRRCAMVVPTADQPGARLKRWLSDGWCELALGRSHAVDTYLALADVLGVPRRSDVVPPRATDTSAIDALLGADWHSRRLAVVHPSPMFRYKAWTPAGWSTAVAHLAGTHGLRVLVTGGPGEGDRRLAEAIVAGVPQALQPAVTSAAGRLSLAELAVVLEAAAVYVGPDTSVTHLAAACGTPTIALFGPSHPIAWAPWPAGGAADRGSPWVMKAAEQRSGNVTLLQGEGDCVPCLQEGCERRLDSPSRCLDELSPRRVCTAIDIALLPG